METARGPLKGEWIKKCGTSTLWNTTQPLKKKVYHSQENGPRWRNQPVSKGQIPYVFMI